MGDRPVSDLDEAKIQFAENRILGIRAELDHSLKLQVAQAIGINADHIVLGDHLFYQADRETVGQVLKSEEFTKLQVAADKEVSAYNVITSLYKYVNMIYAWLKHIDLFGYPYEFPPKLFRCKPLAN